MKPVSASTAPGAPEHRLLLIARDFPPAPRSAALRAASFSRHLPEHGWATTVVTVRRSYHGSAHGGQERVGLPAGCRVVEAFGFDSKQVFSWRGRYPAVLAFPDRDASWIVDGVRQAMRVCRETRIDAILSTSPPVSAHVIAYAVKKLTGLPWLLDLRDPWSLDTPMGSLLRVFDRRLEQRMLRASDTVVTVTADLAADLVRRYGADVGGKVRVLHNGYDEDAMAALSCTPPTQCFTIVHTGTCLPGHRDPSSFLDALRLCLDRNDLPGEVLVDLIGTPIDAALRTMVTRSGLDGRVRLGERISHREALVAVARAPLLLLLQTRADHAPSIPVKAYEYLRTNRPILAIAADGSATAELLRGFEGVTVVPPTDVEAIARALAAEYRAWVDDRGRRFARDAARYSRRHIAADLARLLEELRTASGAGG